MHARFHFIKGARATCQDEIVAVDDAPHAQRGVEEAAGRGPASCKAKGHQLLGQKRLPAIRRVARAV